MPVAVRMYGIKYPKETVYERVCLRRDNEEGETMSRIEGITFFL